MYDIVTSLQKTGIVNGLVSQIAQRCGRFLTTNRDVDFFSEQQIFFRWYVKNLGETKFGRDHCHEHIFGKNEEAPIDETYEIRKTKYNAYSYSDLREYVHMADGLRKTTEDKRYYALSGGTSDINQSNKKYIYIPPVVKKLTQRACMRLMFSYMYQYPDSEILSKKILPFGGSVRQQEDTRRAGDVSALLMEQQGMFGQALYPYHLDILTAPWKEKYEFFLENVGNASSPQGDMQIGALLGVTKRLALFLEDMEKRDEQAERLKGSLEAVFWGGVDSTPYASTFDRRGIDKRVGIYNAAEGFIGFQDLQESELWYRFAPTGFFEFAPSSSFDAEGKYIPGAEVKASWQLTPEILERWGNKVVLIYSTPGQVRSIMDVLHMKYDESSKKLRFQIVGRVTGFINLVGEELLEQQVHLAMKQTCQELGIEASQYTVAPCSSGQEQYHEWYIEVSMKERAAAHETLQEVTEIIETVLDKRLQKINGDYADKRGTQRLKRARIRIVKPGSFDAYLASQKKLGGQNKIRVMSNKREYIEYVGKFFEEGNYFISKDLP